VTIKLIKKLAVYCLHLGFALTLAACAPVQIKEPVAVKTVIKKAPCNCVCTQDIEPVAPVESCRPELAVKAAEAKIAEYGLLKAAQWDEVDGLRQADLSESWPAWMQSCSALASKPVWQSACAAASELNPQLAGKTSAEKTRAVTAYFQQHFSVYKTTNIDGTDSGTITGYYEPLLKGSRSKSAEYPYPLYMPPLDLVTVELSSLYPELKYKRVRGRLIGNKLVPYYNRAEIDAETSPISGREFIYIDDIIDVFFLQIQGSGLVQLDTGERVHVGYADQNGQSYNSIGRLLIERGELTASKASMQGIKNWARNNLTKLSELLNSNPSYVFFRELPAGLPGPLGALGVPILAERVVAVDPKFVPLGAPVFLSTTQPNSSKPLQRMVMAQDTGGAIKGGVRADFFWGAGFEAGAKAGSMKQSGKIWVFLPKEFIFKEAP
jgi:membrane-bound lytic murein transglycosylase A